MRRRRRAISAAARQAGETAPKNGETERSVGMTPEQVIAEVKASGTARGRGGAGFPTGTEMELHAASQYTGMPSIWCAIRTKASREHSRIATC